MVPDEAGEPVEVELPDPSLSPTSKLIHNNRRTEVGVLSELQQEIKRYELCMNPGRDADVLAFWKLFAADLPNLARIARIVLAIPASSSKSERVFSTGGLVVSSKRLNIFFSISQLRQDLQSNSLSPEKSFLTFIAWPSASS